MNYAVGFRRSRNGRVLDVTYPDIRSDEDTLSHLKTLVDIPSNTPKKLSLDDYLKCRDTAFVNLPNAIPTEPTSYATVEPIMLCITDTSNDIRSTEEAYFRLQLLSQRKIKPNEQNLNGLFTHLPINAWTNRGPMVPDDAMDLQAQGLLQQDPITITHVDKFPYMVNYHIPTGVRIADASRVRLGAYLSEGTTVMPAGYINFNAGTLGNAMIEGRVSAGVIVGADSDIGGGASIMGTLSGGNEHVISVGQKCLLGANAGIGISLGDDCTVAAGVYVYASKKVSLVNEDNAPIDMNGIEVRPGENIIKAETLSGCHNKLFIEDSLTGQLICKPNKKVITLNKELHANV